MGRVKSGAVKDPMFFELIRNYLITYLPTQRNFSPLTIKAYKSVLDSLLGFVTVRKGIALAAVTFEMIDCKMITAFLDRIEECGGSIVTRNHRLACIRAFYAYAAKMEPAAVIFHAKIFKVPLKKSPEPKVVDHMSEDAVAAILAQPDTSTKKGLRDQFIMLLLYDTGARIQELMDITLRDIQLGKTPTATLHGKGGKTRLVPLMEKTVEHYHNYVSVFHADEPPYSTAPLFYTWRGGQKSKMHHDTPRKLMNEYGVAARRVCLAVPENVHPHLWRHTRAAHLYQHGMDLTLVSQWLGHAQLETTIAYYAHADTEHKRKAIEAAVPDNSPLKSIVNPVRCKVTDDELLKRLYGL